MFDLAGKHIAILGKSQSGSLYKWDCDETWGVNNVATHPEFVGKKFDKLFAFDFLEQSYTDDMKKHAPVMSWQPYADLKFPIDELIAEFKTRYFTNTISYMVAYAAFCKVKKISVYGVDVSFGAPYAMENRGVEYWIGRAQERGVEVEYPECSHLIRTCFGSMYGEVNKCNMMLYLHERLNLINLLPQKGDYTTAIKAQNAWWVLFPKDDEAKTHNVRVERQQNGALSFTLMKQDGLLPDGKPNMVPGGSEYVTDVLLPPEVWQFLRDILVDLETKKELPFGLIATYEKIVLGKESTK